MADAPGKQKAVRRENFLGYITKGIWKQQPIWTTTFLMFCALMAVAMWVQSGRVQGDPGWAQNVWFRLMLSITVFVLPSVFYAFYAWWTRQK